MKSRILGTPFTQGHPWWKTACVVALLCAAAATRSPAQTYTTLLDFDGTNGAGPKYMAFIQGKDGNLYGTTEGGGATFGGTVFKVTPTGTLTTLYSFCPLINPCPDGADPVAGLVLGTDGKFYGTLYYGGNETACYDSGCGAVFSITPEGTVTTLHVFDYTDGAYPEGALVQGANGIFYGTTQGGGANGYGTVFSITPGGTLTTLHSFDYTDGAYPEGALVQGTNGIFYGTTYEGGSNACRPEGCGTVFSITSAGTLTTLHDFAGEPTEGANPATALVQAANGIFYGTTVSGGPNNYGTVFSISSAGTLTTLYSFCSQSNCTDGYAPSSPLVQATNGTFYGETYGGGANDYYGTLFSITSGGTLTTLYSYGNPGTFSPEGGLFQATNGTLYGTTLAGSVTGVDGTIFSLGVGLGPFVETMPTSGKVGAAVTILGTNLTGATSVTFNGTAATFTVVSSSEITTTVPSGATTGKIKVATPHHTLLSNVNFRVTQ